MEGVVIDATVIVYELLNREISARSIKTELFKIETNTNKYKDIIDVFGSGKNDKLDNVFVKLKSGKCTTVETNNVLFLEGIDYLKNNLNMDTNRLIETIDFYFCDTYYSGTDIYTDVSLSIILKNAILLYDLELKSVDELLFVNLDVSGIQNFIYQVTTDKALKSLRFRSFYVGIMVSVMQEQLLDLFDLSTNYILYDGGGSNYMVIPYSEDNIEKLNKAIDKYRKSLLEMFTTSLAIMIDYVEINKNDLFDKDSKELLEKYKELANKKSNSKLKKYNKEQLVFLNSRDSYELIECKACSNVFGNGNDTKDGRCSFCTLLVNNAANLFDASNDIYISDNSKGIPLPSLDNNMYINFNDSGNIYLKYVRNNKISQSNERRITIQDYSPNDCNDIQLNQISTPKNNKLSMLMCDIDDMGTNFISGNNSKHILGSGFIRDYLNITRSMMLSHRVSTFFETSVKSILRKKNKVFSNDSRKVIVIYAGGDDLCIIGPWYDLVDFLIEMNAEWDKYSSNELTISSAINMYNSKYPIKNSAESAEYLLSCSKRYSDPRTTKDSITIFNDTLTLSRSRFNRSIEIFKDLKKISKNN